MITLLLQDIYDVEFKEVKFGMKSSSDFDKLSNCCLESRNDVSK